MFYNKKILGITALLILIALPVSAATIRTGEEYSLIDTEVIEGDFYAAGGNVTISGEVQGDLVASGGSILVNGTVADDILVAAGAIDVIGQVGDDLRLAGGQIRVGDGVGGDLVAAGGFIQVLSSVSVAGDLVVAGGRVVIEGDVGGDVTVYAGEVEINGTVQGDTTLFISEKTVLGDTAVLQGDLVYSAPKEASLSEGAVVRGATTFNETRITRDIETFIGALFGLFFITKVLALLTVGLLGVLIFRKFSDLYVKKTFDALGANLLRGFIVLILVPILLFFFFVTTIGFFVGVLGALAFVTLMLLAKVYAGIMFGALLSKWVHKEITLNWQWTIVGITLLQIISLIPIVGWFIVFATFLVAFGALSHLIYHHFWLNRA